MQLHWLPVESGGTQLKLSGSLVVNAVATNYLSTFFLQVREVASLTLAGSSSRVGKRKSFFRYSGVQDQKNVPY